MNRNSREILMSREPLDDAGFHMRALSTTTTGDLSV